MSDVLDLSHLGLDKIPPIPEGVTNLDISYNDISSISKLPSSVKSLNCSHNKIKELKNVDGIIELNCSYNKISKVSKLSQDVRFVDISNNLLKKNLNINKENVIVYDHNNLYNSSKVKNECFDPDLNQDVDINFYLISSKDNLIIRYKNKIYCYNRDNFLFEKIGKNKYIMKDSLFNGVTLSELEMKHLKSRYYSLYDFKTDVIIPYKKGEYF